MSILNCGFTAAIFYPKDIRRNWAWLKCLSIHKCSCLIPHHLLHPTPQKPTVTSSSLSSPTGRQERDPNTHSL